jgi:hypothetical protein
MSGDDRFTAITVKKERMFGLKLRAMHVKPRTSVAAYLDHLLEKAGIPLVPEKEFNDKQKQEAIAK